jgi:very-short-patch-repair endonuclease
MAGQSPHAGSEIWALVQRQHGVVTRAQLLDLGYSRHAIEHRLRDSRLFQVHRGVYAVGRPELSQLGQYLAAVLACGPGAALSHLSAAVLWRLLPAEADLVHVSVPFRTSRTHSGLVVHRRRSWGPGYVMKQAQIPVTSPLITLIDIAPLVRSARRDAAINEADKLGLLDPPTLRAALEDVGPMPGTGILKRLLDRHTFVLTDSELERRFVPLARRAGLSDPLTRQLLNGFRVDFYWPDLGLVVETDGLAYHRTPLQQARDRLRDQAHTAAGLTPLRFTRAQVRFEPAYVERTLATVARRLKRERAGYYRP